MIKTTNIAAYDKFKWHHVHYLAKVAVNLDTTSARKNLYVYKFLKNSTDMIITHVIWGEFKENWTYSIKNTCPSLTDKSSFFLNAPGGRTALSSPGNFCAFGHRCTSVRTTCRTEFGRTFCIAKEMSSSSSFPEQNNLIFSAGLNSAWSEVKASTTNYWWPPFS
jgi:hypothetical protein